MPAQVNCHQVLAGFGAYSGDLAGCSPGTAGAGPDPPFL